MEAFRRGNEDMRGTPALAVPFGGKGIAGADGDVPVESESSCRPLGGILNLPGKGPQGSDPQEVGPPSFFRFGAITCFQQGGDDQGIGLAATGGCIHQATLAVQPGLPCFKLKGKRKPPLIFEPVNGVCDAGMGIVLSRFRDGVISTATRS